MRCAMKGGKGGGGSTATEGQAFEIGRLVRAAEKEEHDYMTRVRLVKNALTSGVARVIF